MKSRIMLSLIGTVFVAVIALIFLHETPLPQIPQSKRCDEMLRRRDQGEINISHNATKNEVRRILGDPQNSDQDGPVWIWLSDWDGFQRSGLPHDWLTMSDHSGGHDGLWIGFDTNGIVRTPLWSLSAATPPASDVH